MPVPVEIEETEIEGVLLIKTPIYGDHRGYFQECYARDSWADKGFRETFVQDNLSKSCKGTLRGMHYQLSSHGQGKLVRALEGSIYDVVIDLRRGSPTFGNWFGCELSAENGHALWVPIGFAHGFIALQDDTLVLYKVTTPWAPQAERSLNYKDPRVNIQWPIEPTAVSPKDEAAPFLDAAEYDFTWAPPIRKDI
ncbi:MAG: dTDP-4-dehydrorhamnose 3,5-epimerase [FCB group bacterium]|jgi:dTDP-4-dehydrorhamnose 3,5-epimerase|nr:dTDP-4-dehydrorhamnose 3,5-epimerase [FCB group bacterium]